MKNITAGSAASFFVTGIVASAVGTCVNVSQTVRVADDRVYACGSNNHGQLAIPLAPPGVGPDGLGPTETFWKPTRVNKLNALKQLVIGDAHSMALADWGDIYRYHGICLVVPLTVVASP